jgi:hypothetical protein
VSETDMEALARARKHAKWDGDAAAIAWAQRRIAGLEAQIDDLRQSLIGGVEGVKAGRDMKKWAEANDRLLRKPKR